MQRRDPYRRMVPQWAGSGSDPAHTSRRLIRWLSQGDRLVAIAIAATALGWLAYGWYAATVFADPGQSVPSRFSWELPTAISVAIAVGIGMTLPNARGLVAAVIEVAAVTLGLLIGVVVAGGFPSPADEDSFVTFAAMAAVLMALAWALGVALARVLQRRGTPRKVETFVATVVIATLLTWLLLGAFARGDDGSGRPWTGRSWQTTEAGELGISAAWWDAPAHAFLPRFDRRTVALLISQRPLDADPASPMAGWRARDQSESAYEAVVWPNRRPLRRVGAAVPGGATNLPFDGTDGWLAFVVPPGTEWLDVTVEAEGGPRAWRVDADGVRAAP